MSYVYGDDLISRKKGGEARYHLYDGHGSVRPLTDAAGNVTDSYIYDAFGNLRDHAGSADNRYLYAGEQYDPDAGLYYLRARYYDPANGRFMTHDLYEGNPYEPVTLHRYLYAGANPVMYADPSGKFFSVSSEYLTVMGIITSMTTMAVLAGNAIHEATKTNVKTRSGTDDKNTIILYRGVNGKHPGLFEARMGIAIPWGGHSDPDEHNFGNVRSNFTSWSEFQDVAEHRADLWASEGFSGVVLRKEFHKRDPRIVTSPDEHQEGEVLIMGPVYNAQVICR